MEGSAVARTIPYRATAKRTNDAIKAAYLQELKGNPLPSQILGLDIDALSVRIGNYGEKQKPIRIFILT